MKTVKDYTERRKEFFTNAGFTEADEELYDSLVGKKDKELTKSERKLKRAYWKTVQAFNASEFVYSDNEGWLNMPTPTAEEKAEALAEIESWKALDCLTGLNKN